MTLVTWRRVSPIFWSASASCSCFVLTMPTYAGSSAAVAGGSIDSRSFARHSSMMAFSVAVAFFSCIALRIVVYRTLYMMS